MLSGRGGNVLNKINVGTCSYSSSRQMSYAAGFSIYTLLLSCTAIESYT